LLDTQRGRDNYEKPRKRSVSPRYIAGGRRIGVARVKENKQKNQNQKIKKPKNTNLIQKNSLPCEEKRIAKQGKKKVSQFSLACQRDELKLEKEGNLWGAQS